MGSAAVTMMVGERLPAPAKKLHPFFTTPRSAPRESIADEPSLETADSWKPASDCADKKKLSADESSSENGSKSKRRKRDHDDEYAGPVKRRPGRPRKKGVSSAAPTITNHFVRLDSAASPATDELKTRKEIDDSPLPLSQAPESALNTNVSKPVHTGDDGTSRQKQPVSPKPKRLLKINPKTGTIGSPLRQKEVKTEPQQESRFPRTRRKKQTSRIVSVPYGQDDESRIRIGGKIDTILGIPTSGDTDSKTSSGIEDKMAKRSAKAVLDDETVAKYTHPFFLGKSQKPPATASPNVGAAKSNSPAGMKCFTSTPCSPRKPYAPAPSVRMPQFGIKNPGLKVPGSKLPAWPWKDMVHVRGSEAPSTTTTAIRALPFSLRKSKGHSVGVDPNESIVAIRTRQLNIPGAIDSVRNVNTDEFLPAPPELRLPKKHFESGRKLQDRVLPELSSHHSSQKQLFDSIRTTLSAFDKSQCESSSWTQKYAPACALEVIQSGREPILLREWLNALKVQSVDTGPGDMSASGGKSSKAASGGQKKKRKRNKLDGFVVSSDDEGDFMEELSDDDTDWSPSGRHGLLKKTVIRTGDVAARGSKDDSRLTNAVVISGPHGCGKTAVVYAIAKELDFEVFEINGSSRRSGKDVLEKIGDMTRNHLVQQHQANKSTLEAEVIVEDDVAKEIKSGKQATMNSFFKSKAAAKTKKSSKQAAPKPQPSDTRKTPPKSQKQSLILLEEVDVLYEEDKQFWTTVIGLITQSKRPFIMTCNDETLVPLQSLSLYGIFRFSPPPTPVAVDRLLMIAANEGHALRREAVKSLYDARGHDFRATLTDLNYWCQIGVGDRRGGFDWFYLRWPKGIDLDEEKQVVRVVSEDTYQAGMGWLGHDNLVEKAAPQETELELLQQTWDSWHLDIGQWHDSLDMKAWVNKLSNVASATVSCRLAVLEAYDQFADAMSMADNASSMAFATGTEEPIDPTLPELSTRTRDDYIIGLQVLEAPIVSHCDSTSLVLSTCLKSTARRLLKFSQEPFGAQGKSELDEIGESFAIQSIREHFTKRSPWAPAVGRIDFALAFDPIAASEGLQSAAYLDLSVFDGNLEPITLDVAPYVRGIVAYEARLQKQRLKLSSLVSEGGRGAKRMRTTRAAMSALEGGSRSTTRKERWFKADLNNVMVMQTGGDGWDKIAARATGTGTRGNDGNSSCEDSDGKQDQWDEDGDELA